MIEWEDLRKQARQLENKIDSKLSSFIKLAENFNDNGKVPLLSSELVIDSAATEVEQLLTKLSAVNDKLGEMSSGTAYGPTMVHTLARHREVLQDFRREFRKTQDNHRVVRDRENLIQNVRKDLDSYNSTSGLRQIDLYTKENHHIRNSERMVDQQISLAVETREHLMLQRLGIKHLQSRVHDLSSRLPAVHSLMQRITLRKRRHSLVLGLVVGVCTLLLLLYSCR